MAIKALFCDPPPNEARPPPPLGWGSDFRPPPPLERNFSSKNPVSSKPESVFLAKSFPLAPLAETFLLPSPKKNPISLSGREVLIALTHQRTPHILFVSRIFPYTPHAYMRTRPHAYHTQCLCSCIFPYTRRTCVRTHTHAASSVSSGQFRPPLSFTGDTEFFGIRKNSVSLASRSKNQIMSDPYFRHAYVLVFEFTPRPFRRSISIRRIWPWYTPFVRGQ